MQREIVYNNLFINVASKISNRPHDGEEFKLTHRLFLEPNFLKLLGSKQTHPLLL